MPLNPLGAGNPRILLATAGSNILLGTIGQIYVIARLGFGSETDAMYAAQAVYLIAIAILGSVISSALTPVLAKTSALQRTRAFKSIIIPISAALVVMIAPMIMFTREWVALLFPGLSQTTIVLTTGMAQLYAWLLLLSLINTALASMHRADARFVFVERTELTSTIVSLAGLIVLLPREGIIAVPSLSLIKAAIMTIVFALALRRSKDRSWDWVALGDFVSNVRASLLGFTLIKTGPLIDRYIASHGSVGELALVSFASTVYSTYSGLIDRVVVSPHLVASSRLPPGRGIQMSNYRALARRLLMLSVAASAGIVLLAESVLYICTSVGWANSADSQLTWHIFAIMSLCLWGVTGQIAASTLYALNMHGTVSRVATLNFAITSAFKFVLFPAIGVYAIAIGIAGYQVLNSLTLHYALKMRLKSQDEIRL